MQLQEGFVVFHDGIDGERTTPTGAAIIKYLAPANAIGSEGMRLKCSGTRVGGKLFTQIPNGFRIIAFEDVMAPQTDRETVFEFEIDDQTPEDLAVGIEAIRQTPGCSGCRFKTGHVHKRQVGPSHSDFGRRWHRRFHCLI